jgi:DNA polymerase
MMRGTPIEVDLASLAWQVELGADEAIGETPVNRFEAAAAPVPLTPNRVPLREAPEPAVLRGSAEIAAACADLAALRAALEDFQGCTLRLGARNVVFADGHPRARVMVIGEAPGREEDRAGLPFVGRSGQLLDRMLAAIGLSRRSEDPATAAYITNTLPWRPPGNREPSADEIAMMLPFLHRHIELKAPEVLLLVGAAAVRTLMQTGEGITRMRGRWLDWRGVPAIATFHPAALLRDGTKKRDVWADLLTLRARLDAAP